MAGFRAIWVCCLVLSLGKADAQVDFTVLTYHDVVTNKSALYGDAITTETLVNHFEWLLNRGYQPIRLSDVIANRKEGKPLPPKAVLLTFDDGFISFYTRVYPLLKLYRFPAVVALVGKFMETNQDSVQYTLDSKLPRSAFMSWQQIKEIQGSGWVDICSHSYGLHQERQSNREGNLLPSATTFIYDTIKQRKETNEEYQDRIYQDLVKSRKQIFQETGQYPQAIVWPYGRYSQFTNDIADSAGFATMFNLNSKTNRVGSQQKDINRFYITFNANTDALRDLLNQKTYQPIYRFLAPGPKVLFGEDKDSAELLLNALVKQAYLSRPNAIVLPLLYARKNKTIVTSFPNAEIPYNNVHLNRLVWQMQSRAGTDVVLRWDEALWAPFLSSPEKRAAFFAALGRNAPARAVMINQPALVAWLDTGSTYRPNELAYLSAAEHRHALLQQMGNGPLGNSFSALETFEYFQSDQKVFLLVTPQQTHFLTDGLATSRFQSAFNGIVFDFTGHSVKDIKKWLKNANPLPSWYAKLGLLLPTMAPQDQKKINQWMVAKKIVHWGYGIDDLEDIYRLELPVNTKIILQ